MEAANVTRRLPLLPVALVVTAGVTADRLLAPPLAVWALLLLLPAAFWLFRNQSSTGVGSTVILWFVAGCFGGIWHQLAMTPAVTDLARTVPAQGLLLKVRGCVESEVRIRSPEDSSLVSQPDERRSSFLLRFSQVQDRGEWQPAAGVTRVTVGEAWLTGRVGQRLELFGTLFPPPEPANPGGVMPQAYWHDQGVFSLFFVKNNAGLRVIADPSPWVPRVLLGRFREWLRTLVTSNLPVAYHNVALALLLGDQSALTRDQFETFQQAGVFHVLAVSGQHLVILCFGLAFLMRLGGLSARALAGWQITFVILYALITGANPPVVRAALIVVVLCVGRRLRRPANAVNSLALAWIVLIVWNPTSIFLPGVQLSFLAVLTLLQGAGPLWHKWMNSPDDPLAAVARVYEPAWLRVGKLLGGWLIGFYIASTLVWIATAPILATRYHLVAPIAILVGPPTAILIGVALIGGFLMLTLAALPPLSSLFAYVTSNTLAAAEALVQWAQRIPGGHFYVPNLPEAWLAVSIAAVLSVLAFPKSWRTWKIVAGAALLLAAGAVLVARPKPPFGLRITVLAVGHGSCAVAELPTGEVFLFDAGSLGGPEVATWVVAPYLWSRGHTRIDEVFLSHADLDHFNGLPALLDRFRIGQISMNPSFREKPTPGVATVLHRLERASIPMRLLTRGETLRAGGLEIAVLHPPRVGPPGTENARSLVLLLRWEHWQMLLTGDLEKPGLEDVISRPAPRVDVLIAPHHGSPISNTPEFAAWAQAPLIVSSEGWPRGRRPDPYGPLGGTLWRTFDVGAVTIEAERLQLTATTFRSGQSWHAPLPDPK